MNNAQPPGFPFRLLNWFCPRDLVEGIEGDLEEQFQVDVQLLGERKARRKLLWHTLRFFRLGILVRNRLPQNILIKDMFQNYITIAWRTLWRSKVHSAINISGLALGIACCLLIALFVRDETSFDAFHSKADRIYRVYAREDWGEKQQFFGTVTPFPMGPALKESLQEVEMQVRITTLGTQVKLGTQQFTETIMVGGKDFFKMFDFKEVAGNGNEAMQSQSGIVLTRRMAQKYFGATDPIHQSISIQLGEKFEDFVVQAVTENIPPNSSIQYDLLISELNLPKLFSEQTLTSAWFNIVPETYILLRQGTDPRSVEAKFPSIFQTILGEDDFKKSKYAPGLQSITDIHLNPDYPVGIAPVSNPRYSYILSGIAILILLVACINFVTLSIGRSTQRAKEVGIRKVVGALRTQLINQFLGEAIIVTFIALLIGIASAYVSMSFFNDLSGKQLAFSLNVFFVIVAVLLLVIIGIFSGSYPALVMSGYQPISILKGKVSGSSRQTTRKILVAFQLSLSIFLISSTVLMRQQFSFLQNKNMGFDKEQLAVIPLVVPREGRLSAQVNAGFAKAELFKTELQKIPSLSSICAASHDFGNGNWVNAGFTDDKNVYHTFNMNIVDDEYIPALKIELVAGRNFADSTSSDKRRSVIVNEAFVKEYGWSDAIGMKIPGKKFSDHEIIGVVKDFNYSSLYTKVEPLVIVEDPSIIFSGIENINVGNSPIPKVFIRIKPGEMQRTIDQVKETWEQLTTGEEFSFSFVDQAMAKQYKSDQNLSKIVGIATLLAVLIGSLGLYALSSLVMQNRMKEVSIRKVMGAGERSLLYLLSKEYVVLVGICLLISVPATWLMMSKWLSTFEYRIGISADAFLLAGGIALMIALLTISVQVFKTVAINPLVSLKNE